MDVRPYSGIPAIARLGETLSQVTSRTTFPYVKVPLSEDPSLEKLNFTEGLHFTTLGIHVYFRRMGVTLIVAQEPFRGVIANKKIKLFSFAVPPVENWETHLFKELGLPDTRASGGRFGSEILFYEWGDISYNRMGPNQIAIYRDPEIKTYRQTNFGRELSLFPQKK